MASKTELQIRRDFWQSALEKLRKAYLALADGGVKSYAVEGVQLTRLDLPELSKKIQEAENKVDEYTAKLSGKGLRKTVGVLPRDW